MEGQTPKSPEQQIAFLEQENAMLREANELLIEQVKDLTEKANIDELTSLDNRNALADKLKLIFHRKREGAPERREGGQENNVCVIMIDIDHFKNVNDTYGHGAGDKILKEVSTRLKNSIRSNDFIARYGGEEILILLVEASKFEADKKAERLRKLIESETFDYNGTAIPVTISVGVTFGDRNSDPEKLIEEADKALYESKHSGRNKVTAYSQTLE